MSNISLKQLLTEAKEVKIYLNKGEKPPKGKKAVKGPKGGMYFMGSPEEKKAKDTKKPASKPKVNIFDKPKAKAAPKKVAPKKVEPKKAAKPKATLNTFPSEPGYESQLKNSEPSYIKAAKEYAEDRLARRKKTPSDFSKETDKRLEMILKKNGEYIKRHNMSLYKLDKLPKNNVGKWVNMIDDFETIKKLDDENQQIKKELEQRKGGTSSSKKTPQQHQEELDKIGNFSDDEQIKYINSNVSKPISTNVLQDLLDTRKIFTMSGAPEGYSEMKEAGKMARRYFKYLEKYPDLVKLGFEDVDVYDPTQDM